MVANGSSLASVKNAGVFLFNFASLRLCVILRTATNTRDTYFSLNWRIKTQRREGAKIENHRIHQNQQILTNPHPSSQKQTLLAVGTVDFSSELAMPLDSTADYTGVPR